MLVDLLCLGACLYLLAELFAGFWVSCLVWVELFAVCLLVVVLIRVDGGFGRYVGLLVRFVLVTDTYCINGVGYVPSYYGIIYFDCGGLMMFDLILVLLGFSLAVSYFVVCDGCCYVVCLADFVLVCLNSEVVDL